MKYSDVIWDWNGTLADDVDCTVDCVNDLLLRLGLPKTDREEYLGMICPSIREYYAKLIDLEQFPLEQALLSFQQSYAARIDSVPLMAGAEELLSALKARGCAQHIVSSFEHNAMAAHVRRLGVFELFDSVSGAGDILCGSKGDRAKRIADRAPGGAVYIGDSINDYNTAVTAGCDCILIAKGHQNRRDLERCKPFDSHSVTVLCDIREAADILL